MECKGNMGKAVRRGIALGLLLTGLWLMSLIVSPELLGSRLWEAEEKEKSGVWRLGLLTSSPYFAEHSLRRMLIGASPQLTYLEPLVLGHRLQPPEPEQAPEEEPGEETPIDNDDQTKPELEQPEQDDSILEITAEGKKNSKYLWGENACLYNRTELPLDASVLSQGSVHLEELDGPQILIVHTHGSEAYAQTDGNSYEESDPYRTTDCSRNIVRVGEEMATVFRNRGFRVLHDTNLYDYPSYNGSYTRSGAAVEKWLEQYPSIQIVLDVHRDALVGKDGQIYKLVTEEKGEKVAQVMFVVGSNEAYPGHTHWQDNLALAVRFQQGLTWEYQSLARPIVLRSKTYNQDLLPGALLVEVGGHGNTLNEAIAGARLWADNVSRTLRDILEEQSK